MQKVFIALALSFAVNSSMIGTNSVNGPNNKIIRGEYNSITGQSNTVNGHVNRIEG